MKEITLLNSDKKAKCDDEDYDYLNQFDWYLSEDGFAVRYIEMDGANTLVERRMEEDALKLSLFQ